MQKKQFRRRSSRHLHLRRQGVLLLQLLQRLRHHQLLLPARRPQQLLPMRQQLGRQLAGQPAAERDVVSALLLAAQCVLANP